MPKRGQYDAAVIHAILDEGFVCTVAFVQEGAPIIIPTGYARSGDTLYLHGSAASRMLRTLEHGVPEPRRDSRDQPSVIHRLPWHQL